MTWDEFLRWIFLPAMGAAALTALIWTLVVEYREWRDGEW